MKRICAAGPTTELIDIYHGDYIEDINKVIEHGFYGAYLKCWEKAEDPSFESRWNALDGKMLRGAYDFFHPERNAIAQAVQFVAAMGPLGPDDMPPMLDWETTGGTLSDGDREAGYQWLLRVEQLTGRIPVIYGSTSFLAALRLDKRFLRYSLWIANYGVSCPSIPDPWARAGVPWTLWQTSDTQKVPGMRGACDTDLFNGDKRAVLAWIQSSKVL